MTLDQRLQRLWYGPAWRSLPLWPLALLFRMIVASRALLYRAGMFATHHVDIPVVVVGNITVGGTGKTPVAGWVAHQLALRGRKVAVVLRGYGGSHRGAPARVGPDDDPDVVGDEALLHARRGGHIVVIGADRVAAARMAAAEGADVVICDDGLQHTRLQRDFEIAVVDGTRLLGNGWMLPAGPLRDPSSRLEKVHAVVLTRRATGVNQPPRHLGLRNPMQLEADFKLGQAVNVKTGERRELAAFASAPDLHAVAGIGHPQAFFSGLRQAGLAPTTHDTPDHGRLDPDRLPFGNDATVLMTGKDAVKCHSFGRPDWWWVDLDVVIERNAAAALLAALLERTGLTGAGVRLG